MAKKTKPGLASYCDKCKTKYRFDYSTNTGKHVCPIKCDCQVQNSDENAACYTNKHTIKYCPLHAAALELFTAMKEATENMFNGFDPEQQKEWEKLIAKAEGK